MSASLRPKVLLGCPLGLEVVYVEEMDEVVDLGLLPAARKKTTSVTKTASKRRQVEKTANLPSKRRPGTLPKPPAAPGKKRRGPVAKRSNQTGR
jgi:hypothetical protein